MTGTIRPPAIAGVSTGKPTEIATVYPSIAATVPGRLLGQWLDCVPLKVGGIKLSHLLFGLPAGLLALPGFLLLKVIGERYTLTNRSMQIRKSLGDRLVREMPLADIADVAVRQLPGQAFYPAAELDLLNKAGDVVLTLPGVLRADVFRQTILEARDARRLTESSLNTIRARQAG